jgi:hypothetical protein
MGAKAMCAPEWGWGTEDSAQALGYLSRFGSVTVLNGHIHQLMQKVDGNVTFHTARSTAFPQQCQERRQRRDPSSFRRASCANGSAFVQSSIRSSPPILRSPILTFLETLPMYLRLPEPLSRDA